MPGISVLIFMLLALFALVAAVWALLSLVPVKKAQDDLPTFLLVLVSLNVPLLVTWFLPDVIGYNWFVGAFAWIFVHLAWIADLPLCLSGAKLTVFVYRCREPYAAFRATVCLVGTCIAGAVFVVGCLLAIR